MRRLMKGPRSFTRQTIDRPVASTVTLRCEPNRVVLWAQVRAEVGNGSPFAVRPPLSRPYQEAIQLGRR